MCAHYRARRRSPLEILGKPHLQSGSGTGLEASDDEAEVEGEVLSQFVIAAELRLELAAAKVEIRRQRAREFGS